LRPAREIYYNTGVRQLPIRPILFGLLLAGIPALVLTEPIDMNRVNAREEHHWGVNAYHAGYFGKALRSFEEALRLAPDDPLVKTWLARTYFRLGFEDTALSLWKDVIKSGQGTPLLEYITEVVEARGGLGRELYTPELYVVNHELDAGKPGSRAFNRPSSVRALPDGNFFVIAYGSNEVLSLDANSFILSRFYGGLESLDHPFDLISAGNAYFVSEFEGNVITKFDGNFARLKSFGGKGIAGGKLLGPQYLAVDADNYLYVTDWGNRRVSKYDLDGAYLLSFGKNSAGYPYARFAPTGIAVSGDRVYVSEQTQKQVVVFDRHGNYLDALGAGTLQSPEGLLFSDEGTLLVADGTRVMSLALKEELWKIFCEVPAARRLAGLALTPNGEVLAADFDANKVFMISEASTLYTGFFVQVDRVDSRQFPQVVLDLSVEDFRGRPIVGLTAQNLVITENGRPVKDAAVVVKSTAPDPLSVAVVVEDSPELDLFDKELGLCLENIMGVLGKTARVKIIFAREDATLEADVGGYDAGRIQALIAKRGVRNWKFDAGIKAALGEILPDRGRKAVLFLSSGTLRSSSFGFYSLQEVARSLRNNRVRFYPVYLGTVKKNNEIEYILGESGGKSYLYFDPEGLRRLLADLTRADNPTYVVRYTSNTGGDFGRSYIPLEVQALLYKKSGRDESGYFAPLVTK
jgi:DNA-binding beta-propeller fold protein YncE